MRDVPDDSILVFKDVQHPWAGWSPLKAPSPFRERPLPPEDGS